MRDIGNTNPVRSADVRFSDTFVFFVVGVVVVVVNSIFGILFTSVILFTGSVNISSAVFSLFILVFVVIGVDVGRIDFLPFE